MSGDLSQQKAFKALSWGSTGDCFSLDEKSLRRLDTLVTTMGIPVSYRVETEDSTSVFFSDLNELLAWAQLPRQYIKEIEIESNRTIKERYIKIVFRNEKRGFFTLSGVLSTIEWRVYGPEDQATAFGQQMRLFVRSIRKWYSLFYGAETCSIFFHAITAFVPVALLSFSAMNIVSYFSASRYKPPALGPIRMRGDDGSMVTFRPLETVTLGDQEPSIGSWTIGFAIIACLLLLVRAVAKFYPFGVFDLGYDSPRAEKLVKAQNAFTSLFIAGVVIALGTGIISGLIVERIK